MNFTKDRANRLSRCGNSAALESLFFWLEPSQANQNMGATDEILKLKVSEWTINPPIMALPIPISLLPRNARLRDCILPRFGILFGQSFQ